MVIRPKKREPGAGKIGKTASKNRSGRTPGSSTQEVAPGRSGGLGTFSGVFTPSILTIIGVIMYLRFGWVLGNVGFAGAIVIVSLATSITFLTSLSIAAIATDQRVRTGGAYYMISRSLGIETGGAVGIPLYLAQALSVALYTVGFAESLAGVFPMLDEKMVGVITTVVITLVALVSAQAAIRVQYVIMAAIVLSLISLALGSPLGGAPLTAPAPVAEGFWTVFAVFFPAVTGIMAGVNLSGDLANPARSIPRGTLAAVGVGFVVYLIVLLILARSADAATLIADPLVMRRIAFWGDAILLGVWGAALSSAVGSILGAPRILQALARDGILPKRLSWLGRGSGPEDTPRLGTLITLIIALSAVSLGSLNLIAPILTMFFLTTYGVLNVAAGAELFLHSPSFRPKFRPHWSLSLLGAIGCFAAMLLINALIAIVAALLAIWVFLWLERRQLQSTWGDVRKGVWMAFTRAGLLRHRRTADPKNWRPHLLVLSGAPTSRWDLIDLAESLTHNRALMTVASVVATESVPVVRMQSMETGIQEYMERRGVQGLVRVISAPDVYVGAERLVETYGLGALVPNTILLGQTTDPDHREKYCRLIAHIHQARRNALILWDDEETGFRERNRIDVWWGGLRGNGGLMMILAYLLQTSIDWRGAEVVLRIVVDDDQAVDSTRANLQQIVERVRINARPEVLVSSGKPFHEILQERSRDADLVLLGSRKPEDDYDAYYDQLALHARGLAPRLFVLSSEEIAFGEVLQ